jgi:hypothetical protein
MLGGAEARTYLSDKVRPSRGFIRSAQARQLTVRLRASPP